MLRTLFTVGLIALAGLVALKLVFGLLGPLVSLLFWLLGAAIKVLLIGAVVYFILRVVVRATAETVEHIWNYGGGPLAGMPLNVNRPRRSFAIGGGVFDSALFGGGVGLAGRRTVAASTFARSISAGIAVPSRTVTTPP